MSSSGVDHISYVGRGIKGAASWLTVLGQNCMSMRFAQGARSD